MSLQDILIAAFVVVMEIVTNLAPLIALSVAVILKERYDNDKATSNQVRGE